MERSDIIEIIGQTGKLKFFFLSKPSNIRLELNGMKYNEILKYCGSKILSPWATIIYQSTQSKLQQQNCRYFLNILRDPKIFYSKCSKIRNPNNTWLYFARLHAKCEIKNFSSHGTGRSNDHRSFNQSSKQTRATNKFLLFKYTYSAAL